MSFEMVEQQQDTKELGSENPTRPVKLILCLGADLEIYKLKPVLKSQILCF